MSPERERYEERCGIKEYLGGYRRKHAEMLARVEMMVYPAGPWALHLRVVDTVRVGSVVSNIGR